MWQREIGLPRRKEGSLKEEEAHREGKKDRACLQEVVARVNEALRPVSKGDRAIEEERRVTEAGGGSQRREKEQ